ncbi:glycosyltransferase family 2 protein [Photobacterium phosphoreum]|uniref:glycosyltransferase family 2 protein n=1 Tax=Photobacterium phosphoreum TaxID=659 RepID=UPI001E285C33|nr:glycosyltransferase family 2 protein [Photobacterium phosphoreum]
MLDVIIIAYNPDVNLVINNIKKISKLDIVNEIIVVDNSLVDNKLIIDNVTYIPLFDNYGIAKAQNIGIQHSCNNSITDAILLFDQDSVIESDMVEILYGDFNKYKKEYKNIAAIGPLTIDSFSNKKEIPKFNQMVDSLNLLIVKEIIASGKLINKEIISDVGLMNEELFIDGVDHEWCWRATSKNYKIVLSLNALMVHTVGDSRIKIPLIPLSLRVASPIRMYYQYRNFFLLIKEKHTPLFWKIRNSIGYILKGLIFTLFVSDRKERFSFIKKGVIDGIKDKRGRIDD